MEISDLHQTLILVVHRVDITTTLNEYILTLLPALIHNSSGLRIPSVNIQLQEMVMSSYKSLGNSYLNALSESIGKMNELYLCINN